MTAMVHAKLDSALEKSRKNPYNLHTRDVVSNHLITASLWYMLTLWNGTVKELKALQKKVNSFVWAGQRQSARHRVDEQTICMPKKDGGLGIISIMAQTSALAGKMFTWQLWQV
jgi:hypothetical protein